MCNVYSCSYLYVFKDKSESDLDDMERSFKVKDISQDTSDSVSAVESNDIGMCRFLYPMVDSLYSELKLHLSQCF